MKALVGAFNQEKALVGAFSVIVQSVVEPMEHYTALLQAFQELRSLHPDKRLVLVLVDVTLEQLQRERAGRVRHLLHPLNTVLDDSIGCAIWFAARGRGHDRSNDT